MRSLILLGFLVNLLFGIGHSEPIVRLERRDSSSLDSIHSNSLFKRTTSPSNPVSCKDQTTGASVTFDLDDFKKVITHLVNDGVGCAWYKNLAMIVVDDATRQETVFTAETAKYVKNWFSAGLAELCDVKNPDSFSKKVRTPTADAGKTIVVNFFETTAPYAQVNNCDPNLTAQLLAIAQGTS